MPDKSIEETLQSEHLACVDCGISFEELAPRMFSFNGPQGACETCSGIGAVDDFDPQLVVPDPDAPLERAIAPWSGRQAPRYYAQLIASLAAHYGVELDTPWSELPARVQHGILQGAGREEIEFEIARGRKRETYKRRWDGVLGELERRLAEDEPGEETALGHYRAERPCPDW